MVGGWGMVSWLTGAGDSGTRRRCGSAIDELDVLSGSRCKAGQHGQLLQHPPRALRPAHQNFGRFVCGSGWVVGGGWGVLGVHGDEPDARKAKGRGGRGLLGRLGRRGLWVVTKSK